MSTFRTSKYRNLRVKFSNREFVQFQNGTAEVDGDLAERLASFAERHPEYEIEQIESEEPTPRQTRKQVLQEQARERGLDDSGTIADLEARIAAHDEPGDDEPDEDPEDEDPEGSED